MNSWFEAGKKVAPRDVLVLVAEVRRLSAKREEMFKNA